MLKRFITITLVSGFVLLAVFSFTSSSDATASILNSIGDFIDRFRVSTSTLDNVSERDDAPLYKPVIAYENAVVDAVDRANPSVVSIVISKDLQTMERCKVNPFGDLPERYKDFFGDVEFYQPCPGDTETLEIGGGSGFIVSEDGLIVTNKHVVRDEDASYTVFTNDGEKHEAEVLARDPVQDIAILDIDAEDLNPAELGDSSSIKLGQTAIAIGNALEFQNTVSVGVVSGLSRNITAAGAGFVERIEGVIQTDAAINRGNSGGPLLNLKGEVIGVNTAIAQGAQSVGFAIPINRVKRDINSVQESGEIKTPFLGVRYISITKQVAEGEGLSVDHGALVRGSESGPAVVPNSSADNAGVQAEDIILEVGGIEINEENSLSSLIQKHNVGDLVDIKVRRGDEVLNLQATLSDRPEL